MVTTDLEAFKMRLLDDMVMLVSGADATPSQSQHHLSFTSSTAAPRSTTSIIIRHDLHTRLWQRRQAMPLPPRVYSQHHFRSPTANPTHVLRSPLTLHVSMQAQRRGIKSQTKTQRVRCRGGSTIITREGRFVQNRLWGSMLLPVFCTRWDRAGREGDVVMSVAYVAHLPWVRAGDL